MYPASMLISNCLNGGDHPIGPCSELCSKRSTDPPICLPLQIMSRLEIRSFTLNSCVCTTTSQFGPPQFLRACSDMDQKNSFDYFFINLPRSLHYCETELNLPQEYSFRTDQMQVQSLWISLLPSPNALCSGVLTTIPKSTPSA